MAQDAIIALESLHCIRERDDGSGRGSEPYIWPVLVRIDDQTLNTQRLIDVVAPSAGAARVVIQSGMSAGQSAAIPTPVGILRTRLEANLFLTRLILVVALWDEDETPEDAVRAGFLAFIRELGAALGDANNLLALQEAEVALKAAVEANDQVAIKAAEARKAAIIKTITDQVRKAVEAAIANRLTGSQKASVAAGFLNLDDLTDSNFKSFSNALPTPITLAFGKGKPNEFEIRGRLEVRQVRVDRCQAKVNAVKEAQSAVDEFNEQINQLKEQLKQASPEEKRFINSEIKQIRDGDLAVALVALGDARTALSICRATGPPSFPDEAEQVRSSVPGLAGVGAPRA